MKIKVYIIITFLIMFTSGCSTVIYCVNSINDRYYGLSHITYLPSQSNDLYDNKTVLKVIADSINKFDNRFHKINNEFYGYKFGSWVNKREAVGFWIWDLSDTSQNKFRGIDTLKGFQEYHIYYVRGENVYSNQKILYLSSGRVNIFNVYSIVPDKNVMEQIIFRLKEFIPEEYLTNQILERIKQIEGRTIYE